MNWKRAALYAVITGVILFGLNTSGMLYSMEQKELIGALGQLIFLMQDVIGVLGSAMDIGMTRANHFFCSQFVSFILGKTGFWSKLPELTKPMDFLEISQMKIIYEGKIQSFNESSLYNITMLINKLGIS